MFVDKITGEVFEQLTEISDETLGDMLAALEEEYKEVRERYFQMRNAMIGRMEDRDAKMQLTPAHRLRLRKTTQVKGDKASRQLLAQLMGEVPSDMRKAFSVEVSASVSGLKEIAKLGGEFRLKVEALLEERPTLVIEPRKTDADEKMPIPDLLQHQIAQEAGLPW